MAITNHVKNLIHTFHNGDHEVYSLSGCDMK
jgi:hypothetical protein